MKRNMLKRLVLGALVAGSLAAGMPLAGAAVQVNPVAGLRPDFIKGADVSMLPEVEAAGARFYDVDGTQLDEMQIMKSTWRRRPRRAAWSHLSRCHRSHASCSATSTRRCCP